jgi:hypothetical protein
LDRNTTACVWRTLTSSLSPFHKLLYHRSGLDCGRDFDRSGKSYFSRYRECPDSTIICPSSLFDAGAGISRVLFLSLDAKSSSILIPWACSNSSHRLRRDRRRSLIGASRRLSVLDDLAEAHASPVFVHVEHGRCPSHLTFLC